ncbi:MAG: pyruvate dehydrogenase (acetyl-transferring) E1 component subunit alpha [Anaerolineae bacterium]|nr:pyruvate dehydrogenase (acetyl-transferring) E1 component subunit alpha [Anaerolineae bacterium]MCB9108796.1 pyruvate dehydrogenase (acetyl-transferring) E1 component subunit alpha [Anaerolineales bacterium]
MPDNPIYQILTPAGDVIGDVPDLADETLVGLYRWMVMARIFSDRMVALQRQGRMGTFAPLNGQEATCVAMAAPLEEKDWLLGSYRESFPYIVKGVPLLSQMKHWGGHLPVDYPYEARCIPFQIVLATQVLHAVGIAMAIKYKKEKQVVMVGCGDGATSEGDFNEALNFAGVFKPPVIFLVQNNGWAISVPRKIQTAVEYIAQRGAGFGVPSRIVDGNDVLAVYQAVTEAADRAKAGEGATLIEAITYRLGAHTTADDPTKYQPPAELDAWRQRDPITRYRKFLMDRTLLTDAQDEQLHDDVNAEFQAALDLYEALPPPNPAHQFDYTYAELPPQLQRQREEFLELGSWR